MNVTLIIEKFLLLFLVLLSNDISVLFLLFYRFIEEIDISVIS